MTGDETDRGTERTERDGSVDTLRTVVQHGWSGVLGGRGGVEAQTGRRGPGVLEPFSGVLGPWVPSVDGLPPRLSFLAFPWLVREIHTTERVVPDERGDEPTLPGDATAETTTVSLLLRSDNGGTGGLSSPPPGRGGDPTGETASRTVETLHEVLRWRPILIDGYTPPGSAGDRPEAGDGTTPNEPPVASRTFRTSPGETLAGDQGVQRETSRAEDRSGRASDHAGMPGRTDVEVGRKTQPTSVRSVDPRPPGGVDWATGEFRPVLSRTGVPTVLHRSSRGERPVAGDATGEDRPTASTTTRHGEAWGREGGATVADWPTPVVGDRKSELVYRGRPELSMAESGQSTTPSDGDVSDLTSMSHPLDGTVDAWTGRGTTLTYRHAKGRSDGTRREPIERSAERPSATDRDATFDGRPTATPEATPANARDVAPTSPFASFADTDAAVEHVYHEIERRLRIERERRGL